MVTVETPDGPVEFPDEMSREEIRDALRKKYPAPLDDSGAPASVRAVVGASPPQDRLSNLQKFYPDAKEIGDDNFSFKDPGTGKPTIYNPSGLDLGDVASVGREGVQAAAGLGGAALASPTLWGAPLAGAAASTAAGEVYDEGMKRLAGMIDTRSPTERGIGAAANFGLETIGGRYLPSVTGAISKGLTSVKNRLTGTAAAQMFRDFTGIGAKPTAGLISGDKGMQTFEHGVASTLGGAGILNRADDATLEKLGVEAERVASQFGQVEDKAGVSQVIREASKKALTRFEDRGEKLFADVQAKIPETTRAVPHSTLTLIAQRASTPLAKEMPNLAKRVQNKQVQGWLDDFAADLSNVPDSKMTYQSLRYLRSRVGKALSDPMAYPDMDRGELKAMYGAVTTDMERVAKLAGPDAIKAHNRANRWYRLKMDKDIDLVSEMVEKRWDTQAYDLAFSGAKDSGQKLRTLRRNVIFKEPNGTVNKKAWDTIAASTLNRMGQAKPGAQGVAGNAFSPATFLTNYNSMSTGAKEALFGGSQYAHIAPQLDRLTRMSAAFKDLDKTRNFSNTARALGVMGLFGAAGAAASGGDWKAAAGAATLPLIGHAAAAKLLTNQKFVKWLADSNTRQVNTKGWAGHIGRLVAIAHENPDVREEIHQFLAAMR